MIEADDIHRISAACHAHGSFVHSALLAGFALAIGDVTKEEPRRILMRSSVDMRRRLEPHVSAELVFSAITGTLVANTVYIDAFVDPAIMRAVSERVVKIPACRICHDWFVVAWQHIGRGRLPQIKIVCALARRDETTSGLPQQPQDKAIPCSPTGTGTRSTAPPKLTRHTGTPRTFAGF